MRYMQEAISSFCIVDIVHALPPLTLDHSVATEKLPHCRMPVGYHPTIGKVSNFSLFPINHPITPPTPFPSLKQGEDGADRQAGVEGLGSSK